MGILSQSINRYSCSVFLVIYPFPMGEDSASAESFPFGTFASEKNVTIASFFLKKVLTNGIPKVYNKDAEGRESQGRKE